MAEIGRSPVVRGMATSTTLEENARVFRQTGNPRYLAGVVRAILQEQVPEDLLPRLARSDPAVRLVDDLGLDSLALIEIALRAEEAVGVTVDLAELRQLTTVGEIERLLAAKVAGA